MTDEELTFLPACEHRELIATKKISPVEMTEIYLRCIEVLNPQLNAYLTITDDSALSMAREAEQAVMKGDSLGVLHGVPIAIKDLEETTGLKTTMGSLVFKDKIANKDSIFVECLKNAGVVILGKSNTPEFGCKWTIENRLGDACRNPWNLEYTSGGSSGGSAAAVVAGLCSLATGGDAGGSIRIPASFCGTYGINPTQGRVPRYGGYGKPAVIPFSQGGPITRSVRDAAIFLQVIAGPDRRDITALQEATPDFIGALNREIGGLKVSWCSDFGYAVADPEVKEITFQATQVLPTWVAVWKNSIFPWTTLIHLSGLL